MGRRAIIMDRDGTVCDDLVALGDVEEVRLLPGSAAAIRSANARGFQTVLVTRRAEALAEEIHDKVRELLDREGARLDGIYCRPAGGLARARDEMGIDLAASYTIGDRGTDLEDGHRAGTTNVLVLTGKGEDELARHADTWRVKPDHVARDLRAAVDWILEREAAR
jgi:D-glycero-D-manno-heptose 1,7-bisphosphate phosphatase